MNSLNYFIDWCNENNVRLRTIREAFFINEKVIIKPQFIVNERTYIIIVNERQAKKTNDDNYKSFSKSYGSIMVIPDDILSDIKYVTKIDIEKRFNMKF